MKSVNKKHYNFRTRSLHHSDSLGNNNLGFNDFMLKFLTILIFKCTIMVRLIVVYD